MYGSDLSFSMLIRLMDGWSGPADKVRQSMRKMAQSSRDMKREMGRKIKTGFSATEIEAAFGRSERRISQARGRLMGAAAMAVTLGAPVIQAGNFEEKLIDFANLAEIDADRVQKLKTELNALRDVTGQSNVQLLEGLATYVGKGMSLDAALEALPATGRAAKATKSQFDEMANSGYAVMDNLDVMPDRLRQAFDIMAKSGKEGSFELTAMARKFPEITAGAKSLKMEGVDAVASLSAALQIAMKSAGSEDQAATNMTNFLGKITATDTVKKFKKAGVDIEKEMQIALERGADPLLHMLQVIEKMTGGNAFKMGELFADKQVLDFLRAMIPNLKEYQRIKATALGADGVIDKDFEAVMKGFNEEWRQLKNSVAAMLGASGALLPIFTDIMREVRFGVESVSAWTAANPELTATIVKGTAALLAFGIATRVVGFGFAIMQGGILRTASLFLKFDKAGKNVSLLGRAARGAHWSVTRLYRGGRGLMRLMRTPLRWKITPFTWTSKLLPNFAPALARFAGFRSDVAKEISGLTRHVTNQSLVMQRSLSKLRWKAFGSGIMAWSAMNAIPDDPEKRAAWQRDNVEGMDKLFRSTPVLSQLMSGYERLFQKVHGQQPPPATAHLVTPPPQIAVPKTPKPDLTELYSYQRVLQGEKAKLEAKIAKINDGPIAKALRAPLRSDLERIEAELDQVLSELRGLSLSPLTQAIREGKERSLAPETSLRPEARPEPKAYEANQPNVTVESTFTSNPKVDVNVQVSMPVTIKREQKSDNAQVAKRAGREAGAATERAVRRSLDDAANVE